MHEGEWYYSIVDIVAILTESKKPNRYWTDLKAKMEKEESSQLYDKIVQLKLASEVQKLLNMEY